MSNEKKPVTQLDKAHEGHQPSNKALKGETIESKDDNALNEKQKARDAVKSFKLTKDGQESCMIVGLTDKTGKHVVVKDERPLRQDEMTNEGTAATTKESQGSHLAKPADARSGESHIAHTDSTRIENSSHSSHTSIEKSREHLLHTMEHLKEQGKLSEKDYNSLKQNMDRLQERVRLGFDDDIQARKTYEQLDRLVTAPKAALSLENRVLLAENIMYHAAWPHKIDQGEFKTCNMTAAEEHLFTRNPSKAAEIITDVALHGELVSHGKHIKIDAQSLIPMPESLKSPPTDGDRSYATQVLNLALVNDVLQRKSPPQFYSQLPAGHTLPPKGDATHRAPDGIEDSGERITDGHGHEVLDAHGLPDRSPGDAGEPGNIAAELERLTGDKNVMIANSAEDSESNVVHFSSPAALDSVLKTHKMPLIVLVDANNPPWDHKHKAGEASWHFVTIQSYDAKHHQVHVSNQWGSHQDRDVSVSTLYKATREYVDRPAGKSSPDDSITPPLTVVQLESIVSSLLAELDNSIVPPLKPSLDSSSGSPSNPPSDSASSSSSDASDF